MNQIYTSNEILCEDDLYGLQDTFCSSGISFVYLMTKGETDWFKHILGKYSIADWIDKNSASNTDELALLFDDCEAMSKALDDDCKGFGKAVMLSDDTALQKLFFWLYSEVEYV